MRKLRPFILGMLAVAGAMGAGCHNDSILHIVSTNRSLKATQAVGDTVHIVVAECTRGSSTECPTSDDIPDMYFWASYNTDVVRVVKRNRLYMVAPGGALIVVKSPQRSLDIRLNVK